MKLKCLTQILKGLVKGLSLTGHIDIQDLRYVPLPFLAHACSKLSFHHSSPPPLVTTYANPIMAVPVRLATFPSEACSDMAFPTMPLYRSQV